MATALQLRRGTTAQHAAFTGLNGEVSVDTSKKTLVVHDGATAGGIALARADTTATNLANAISAALVNTALTGAPTAPTPASGTRGTRLATMQSFLDEFVSNQSAAGFFRLPNGLLVQWGSASTGASGIAVSFPFTFPTSVFSLTLSPQVSAPRFATYQSLSTLSFFAQAWNTSGTQVDTFFTWIAVGK